MAKAGGGAEEERAKAVFWCIFSIVKQKFNDQR